MARTSPTSDEIEGALNLFGSAAGADLISASDVLIRANALVASAKHPAMAKGLGQLAREVLGGSGSRIQSLARLWHMTAQAPLNRLRKDFQKLLSPLAPGFEPLASLSDPKDRRYAAEALGELAGDWLRDYAAVSLVEEEAGERSRVALASALLTRSENLNAALAAVVTAARNLRIESQDPGTSRALRLIRILDALASATVTIDPPVNEGIGKALGELIVGTMRHDRPAESKVSEDLGLAVVGLARTIIRFHGTLAAESDTFDFVPALRRLYAGTDWPSRLAIEMRAIARTVREALLFLAGKSIADEQLRKVHVALVGAIETEVLMKQAVSHEDSLTPALASWLVTGRQARVFDGQEALGNTVLEQIDEDLANAFLEASEAGPLLSKIADDLLVEARMLGLSFGETTDRFFTRVRKILRHVEAAATKRGLRLGGQTGDVVPFSPHEHQTSDGLPATKMVRLRTVKIERARPNGTVDVVLKAEVDQIRGA